MDKIEYQKKLDATVMTDQNTIADLKAANKLKNQLKKFWEKETLLHIKMYQGEDLEGQVKGGAWMTYKFDFDLKATGTVKVQVEWVNDMGPNTTGTLYTVRKAAILGATPKPAALAPTPVTPVVPEPFDIPLDMDYYNNY